jgi:hypothetical protein
MPHHLAILTDFPEEGWPSMDLCGDMLLAHLPWDGPLAVEAARLCPLFRQLATRLPVAGRRHAALNADRLLNRFILLRQPYPDGVSSRRTSVTAELANRAPVIPNLEARAHALSDRATMPCWSKW